MVRLFSLSSWSLPYLCDLVWPMKGTRKMMSAISRNFWFTIWDMQYALFSTMKLMTRHKKTHSSLGFRVTKRTLISDPYRTQHIWKQIFNGFNYWNFGNVCYHVKPCPSWLVQRQSMLEISLGSRNSEPLPSTARWHIHTIFYGNCT